MRYTKIVFSIGFVAATFTSLWVMVVLVRGVMIHGRSVMAVISTALVALALLIFAVACIRAVRREASFLEPHLLLAFFGILIGRLLVEWMWQG